MSMITLAGLKAVEHLINLALQQDSASLKRLKPLTGQRLYIEVEDLSFCLLIQIIEDGVCLFLPENVEEQNVTDNLAKKDTHVKGTSSAFRKLLDGDGFFDGNLRIQGNAQTLMILHKVMENFEFDWEGILADHIGDTTTSLIAPLLRKKWQWSKETATSFKLNAVEYLQEEAKILPTKAEFNYFIEDLEDLSTRLDRLEARARFITRNENNKP